MSVLILPIMMYLLFVVNMIKCTNPNNGNHSSHDKMSFNANEKRTQGDEMDEETRNKTELKKIMSQYGLKYKDISNEPNSAHGSTFVANKPVGLTQYNQLKAPDVPRMPEMPKKPSFLSQSDSIIFENSSKTTNKNCADSKNDTTSEKQIHQDTSQCGSKPEIVSDGFTSKNGNVDIGNLHLKKGSKINGGGTCSVTTNMTDVSISDSKGKVRIGCIDIN